MKLLAIVFLFGIIFRANAADHTTVVERVQSMLAQSEARFAALERSKKEVEIDRQQRFERDATEFVATWNKFIEAYNGGKLNVKQARQLSREFRELEKRGGWLPKENTSDEKARFDSCSSSH